MLLRRCRWLLAFLVAALAGAAPPDGGAAAPLRLESTRILLPRDQVEPFRAEVVVKLPVPLLEELLRRDPGDLKAPEDDGVEWPPEAIPDRIVLSSVADDGPRPRTLEIGRPGARPEPAIELVTSRAKIRRDEPGRLTLTVRDPHKLRRETGVGVFRGEIPIKLFHPRINLGKTSLGLTLPVELVLPGVRAFSPAFIESGPGQPLRVGRRASLSFEIEAVGVEPGSGRLELDWTPPGSGDAEKLLRISLPLQVPAWDPLDQSKGWYCDRHWSGEPIVEVDRQAEPLQSPVAGLPMGRTRWTLTLPELWQPGEIRGRIHWGDGGNAAERPAEAELGPSLALPPTKVASGLSVSPRVAFLREPVTVYMAVRRGEAEDVDSWGARLPLDPGGPTGGGSIELVRQAEKDGVVYFVGRFSPAHAGDYRVALGHQAPAGAHKLALPVDVRVPMLKDSRLPAAKSLVLFVDSTPMWWSAVYDPEDGNRDLLRRRRALDLRLLQADYAEVTVRQGPMYRIQNGDAYDPNRDPPVRFVAPATSAPKKEEAKVEWALSTRDPLILDLEADLRPGPGGTRVQPSLADNAWASRWIVTGRDPQGRPFARAFTLPVRLRVASSGEWDFQRWTWLAGFVAALLVSFIVTLFVLHKSPKKDAAPPRAEGDQEGGDDGDREYDHGDDRGYDAGGDEPDPHEASDVGHDDGDDYYEQRYRNGGAAGEEGDWSEPSSPRWEED